MGIKGMLRTPEHNAKIGAAHKGKIVSEETRKKLSERNPWWITKHGHASRKGKTPTWYSWSSMLDRCNNPNATHYHRYGGRGITICERWMTFTAFLEDMGERLIGTTLDRINNDGNYEPGNCRWATVAEQNANRKYSTACKPHCACGRHRR